MAAVVVVAVVNEAVEVAAAAVTVTVDVRLVNAPVVLMVLMLVRKPAMMATHNHSDRRIWTDPTCVHDNTRSNSCYGPPYIIQLLRQLLHHSFLQTPRQVQTCNFDSSQLTVMIYSPSCVLRGTGSSLDKRR